MRLFTELYPRIMPRTPGAPEPLVRRECALAAQALCDLTHCWIEWLEPVQAMAGMDTYDIEVPQSARAVLVTGATVDGRDCALASWRAYTTDPADATGRAVIPTSHLEFQIGAQVAPGSIIKLRAVLTPTEEANGVPDKVMALYGQAIADGAIASLMMMPGQPFSDLQTAGLHMARFTAVVDRAHTREWRSRTNLTPRLRPTWC